MVNLRGLCVKLDEKVCAWVRGIYWNVVKNFNEYFCVRVF